MTKTYSEKRQAVYFKAARELRKIAGEILDDVQTPTELRGDTASWAKNQAAFTARKANEIEDLGYGETVASAHTEVANYKSRDAYTRAIDQFEARLIGSGVDPGTVRDRAKVIAGGR